MHTSNTAARTRTIEVDGAALAVDVHGREQTEAPAVVLVHGGTSNAAVDWTALLPALVEDFCVVTFDLRGHGRSTGSATPIGIGPFARDLREVMARLGLVSAALVGCSVGAHAILKVIQADASLAWAVVTIGAGRRGDPSRVDRIVNGPWIPRLEAIHHVDAGDTHHWWRLRERLAHDWAENHHLTDTDLAAVQCPALIVHGYGDRVQQVEQALDICRGLPAGELFVVPGAGHLAQVDRPDLVGTAIRTFLNATRPGKSV